jgi:TPR repeat protein
MDFKFQTALDYKYGNYHEKIDSKAAFDLFTELYECGYKPAIDKLASCYMAAEGTSKDEVKAQALFCEAFKTFNEEDYKDDHYAQYTLAYIYNQDFCPTGKDVNKSKELYTLSAAQGNVMSSMNLGIHCLENNEIDKAIELIMPAVLLGNSLAANNLSVCIDKKTNPDHQESLRLLKSASDQGCHLANLNLAFEYYYGNKVNRNIETSNELLLHIITNTHFTNRFNIEAIYQLGVNCLSSIDCESELEEVDETNTIETLQVIKKLNPLEWSHSATYFKIAAKRGHMSARMQLGVMCMADKTPCSVKRGLTLILMSISENDKPTSLAAYTFILSFCSELGEESPLSDKLDQIYQSLNVLMLEMNLDDDKMFTLFQKQRLVMI